MHHVVQRHMIHMCGTLAAPWRVAVNVLCGGGLRAHGARGKPRATAVGWLMGAAREASGGPDGGPHGSTAAVPVVVVGAGPTGLAASLLLSRLGVRHVLLERSVAGPSPHPQAHFLNYRTMEVFRCGAIAALHFSGYLVHRMSRA